MRSTNTLFASGQNGGKLLGLELLRFIAAFAVLVWHYQHFAFDGTGIIVVREQQPFYALLQPFYEYGRYGVQVFWSISGFIFFWRYGTSVHTDLVSGSRFFVLRFSRLYPLHFATLLLVALLQALFATLNGHYFVYPNNDPYHFLLQLFMASNWGLQAGYSFNGPIWSISAEVLVYTIFYACMRIIGRSLWINSIAVIFSVTLRLTDHATVFSDCIGYFYAGGIGAYMFLYDGGAGSVRIWRRLAWLTALSAPIIAWPFLSAASEQTVMSAVLLYAPVFLYCIAQPLRVSPHVARMIEECGNLTYSSYLLHFPLQLLIALYFGISGRAIPMYHAPLFMFFIGVSFLAAYFVYHCFERPVQALLRVRFGTPSVISGKAAKHG